MDKMDDLCRKYQPVIEAARILHREGFVDDETYASLYNEITAEMARDKDKTSEPTGVPYRRTTCTDSSAPPHTCLPGGGPQRCLLGCTIERIDATDCDGT